MYSHKRHQALVPAVLLAVGLVPVVLLALQSTASNAQTKNGSILFQVAQAPVTPRATTPVPASLIVDGADVGKQVTDSIASLRLILSSITDAASAQAAFRQIQDVVTQIEKFNAMVGRLSAEQRTVLSGLVKPEMPTLDQLFNKVLAIPGVAAVLKPTIDALRPKLAALATAAPMRATTSSGAVVEIVLKEDNDECIRQKGKGKRAEGKRKIRLAAEIDSFHTPEECCVAKLRLVRGAAEYVTNTGKIADLKDPNTVACITPNGDVIYSTSTESILGFDVAAAETAAPGEGAPGTPPTPPVPPVPPITPPGTGGGTTPPTGGGGTPCVNPTTPNQPTCP